MAWGQKWVEWLHVGAELRIISDLVHQAEPAPLSVVEVGIGKCLMALKYFFRGSKTSC